MQSKRPLKELKWRKIVHSGRIPFEKVRAGFRSFFGIPISAVGHCAAERTFVVQHVNLDEIELVMHLELVKLGVAQLVEELQF